jgi:RNA polymerase sigma-70 factor (ECF subfamily)
VPEVDADILARLATGDPRARDKCFTYVKQWAMGELGNLDDAEDVAQATTFEAWRSAHTFRGKAKVSTWLITIARRVIDKRQKYDEFHAPPTESTDATDYDPPDGFDFETAELYRLEVESALKCLTEDERIALLRSLDGLTSDEIAKTMGKSANAVRQAKKRALRKLGEYGRTLEGGDQERRDGN